MFTGVNVSKMSRLQLGDVLGPRDRIRVCHPLQHLQGDRSFARKDFAAFAVWEGHNLISTGIVKVRDGRVVMPEYKLSSNFGIRSAQSKAQGGAWGPPRGSQYGKTCIEKYKDEIKEIFDRGF